MRYAFRCERRHTPITFEVEAPIDKGPPSVVECPQCGASSIRVWLSHPIKWNTSGAHGRKGHYAGDYDSTGDKLEKFNKNWEKKYGEKAPPPAPDVPTNSNDPY